MGKFGFSFSWKRATGLTAAKRRVSNTIGVPLTRAGRQRRVGKALGCLVVFALLASGVTAMALMAR
jgi:hypothetical protein